jgi:hypothetical protein
MHGWLLFLWHQNDIAVGAGEWVSWKPCALRRDWPGRVQITTWDPEARDREWAPAWNAGECLCD